MVHILLKPGLENFEHYFTSVWDECNCAVVWAFFGIAFLWDWNENWPFPVLWPLLSFPDLLACWVQHFHSIWCLFAFSLEVCMHQTNPQISQRFGSRLIFYYSFILSTLFWSAHSELLCFIRQCLLFHISGSLYLLFFPLPRMPFLCQRHGQCLFQIRIFRI